MHGEAAERLFREYLERQGWRYWTESEFRRALGLNNANTAPDFTLLDDTGAPVALIEVSQFTGYIDALIPENGLTPVKTSPLPQKVRKKRTSCAASFSKQAGNLATYRPCWRCMTHLGRRHIAWSSYNAFWG
jgi:hypothetical protein